jgi:uncharacterized membrane protein YphA (DoxX/SURF4 family)
MVELSRIIVGATFLFSGFVKAVDPLGFAYKIEDYLVELGLAGLFSLALPVAVVIVTAEFALGVFLLTGIYRKWTVRLIFLFMIFFTPLTLWIAIANPVEDCGCFGDAFIISNWQTFYKNLVLLAGTILLIMQWRQITPLFSKKMEPAAALFILLLGVLFSLHNVYRLPVLDFRPYKIGANIPRQMFIDPNKADVLETVFIYSKDGVEKEFSEEDYPWNDSTWIFVDMKTKLVKKGEKPAIEDFAVEALYYNEAAGSWTVGGDITDIILSDPSYTFLMVAYSLEKMSLRHLERFRQVHRYAAENGYSFYFLTASSADAVGAWEQNHRTGFQFCHADERELKTMIRANPGLMLLKEGTVINKWDGIRMPDMREKLEVKSEK